MGGLSVGSSGRIIGCRKRYASSTIPDLVDESFIALAKKSGFGALVDCPFPASPRFDSCLAGMVVRSGTRAGVVMAELTVSERLSNSYATLHGGGVATLVDVLGTLALLSVDSQRAGVSLEMSISFVAAAKAGDHLIATGRMLKAGRNVGFTEVDIRRRDDGKLIATGRHTKMLP